MNICDCAVNSYKSSDERRDKHMKKTQVAHAFFYWSVPYVGEKISLRQLSGDGGLNSPTGEQHIRG